METIICTNFGYSTVYIKPGRQSERKTDIQKIWALPVKNFKKFFLWHQAVHIMYLNVDRQGCVIKTVTYRLRTDRHTHVTRHRDRQKFKN